MSITIARPQRTIRPGRARRVLAGLVSTAVVAGGISLATTPAQAAQTGSVTAGTASWGLSKYLNGTAFGGPTPKVDAYVAPATINTTSRISTWSEGTGSVAANGSASLEFKGTSVNFASTSGAWLRLKDVRATLDAAGNGAVTAEVSYGRAPGTFGTPNPPTYSADLAPVRGPERLEVATLVGNTAAQRAVTSTTAAWTGLAGTWATEFTTFLAGKAAEGETPAIANFVYNGQINNTAADRTLEPFSFSVSTVDAKVTSTAVTAQSPTGLEAAATGTGYRAGGVGVYIGVAETGTTVFSDPSALLGAVWSADPTNPTSAVKDDGSFSTTLKLAAADIAKLDPAKSYSVFTIKAHGQNVGDPSQTASAPLAIDFDGFAKYQPIVTGSVTGSTTFGAARSVAVKVAGPADAPIPTGTVTASVGGAVVGTGTLANGAASIALPSTLNAGATSVVLAYAGDESNFSASATQAFTVTAAKVSVKRGTTKKPTTKKTGTSSLTLKSATGAAVDGKVTVTFTKKGQKTKVKTVTIKAGKGKITIPKLAKGTWTVSVKYAGTTNFLKTATLERGSFTVVK